MQWNKDQWALLVQTALHGKARSVFLSLPGEIRKDYDKVKEEILKAYEVTPEFFRNKFRKTRKGTDQKFVEYGHVLGKNLDRWWRALKVESLEDSRAAILLEQFLDGVSPEVRVYICERQITTVSEAATMAEDYVLVSRQAGKEGNFRRQKIDVAQGGKGSGLGGKMNMCYRCNKPGHRAYECQSKSAGPVKCSKCEKPGHRASECRSSGSVMAGNGGRPRVTCFSCGRTGHYSSDCRLNTRGQTKMSGGQNRHEVGIVVARDQVSEETARKEKVSSKWKPFMHDGVIARSKDESGIPVKILRDTGASHTLVRKGVMSGLQESFTGDTILVRGLGVVTQIPLAKVCLEMELSKRWVTVGVADELPIEGVDVLLGNDIGGDALTVPVMSEEPLVEDGGEGQYPACCLEWREWKDQENEEQACVVTRAMAKGANDKNEDNLGLNSIFLDSPETLEQVPDEMADEAPEGVSEGETMLVQPREQPEETERVEDDVERDDPGDWAPDKSPVTRQELVKAQEDDPSLQSIREDVLTEAEADMEDRCYYMKEGLLMRKWRRPDVPNEEDAVCRQVVVPDKYRGAVLEMAHSAVTGHVGIRKTSDFISTYFFWPGMKGSVKRYVQECQVCQIAGKPRDEPKPIPLNPIPVVEEPFSKIIIDVVGPLPKTNNGNSYLLTMMDVSTRYPEAIPLSNVKSRKIVPVIVDFFSKFGVPREVQTDRGTNFLSKIFQEAMQTMGIGHVVSSAYHPQSQGCLERFHQTLKGMLTKYCLEFDRDWDYGIQMALYAVRSARQESLGYSPFELMFGRNPREPVRMLYDSICDDDQTNSLTEYVSKFRDRICRVQEIARKNLKEAQSKMKNNFDKNAQPREFKPKDLVLMFLPVRRAPLTAKYQGPFEVVKKVGRSNYILSTPGRRKQTRMVHTNLLKAYLGDLECAGVAAADGEEVPDQVYSKEDFSSPLVDSHLENDERLSQLSGKLVHLEEDQRRSLEAVLQEFPEVMGNTPSQTSVLEHDVILEEGAQPVRQHPYRLSPHKRELMRKEVEYLLENGLAVPSSSPWASPCLLVPKDNGKLRMCTDYRKLNAVTQADPYPLPRIDDTLDAVAGAKYLTKIDLLKGFYQVPLTEEARRVSAFITPDGLYEYTVMPFGMRNSGSTFQRLANWLVSGFKDVKAYIDDLLVHSTTWEEHLVTLRSLLQKMSEANLTINLEKCDFGKSQVTYLGHQVGQGGIRPVEAKVADIVNFPPPSTRRGLRRFLGMVGYYRRYCKNFAKVAAPLSDLLSERRRFVWSEACQQAMDDLKAILMSAPVLQAPDYNRPFAIMVDASDVGIGAMLGQEVEGVMMPIAFMSRKLLSYQAGYSTVEKEALALMEALRKFEVYLGGGVTIYSDHNPLKFIHSMKSSNKRLARWAVLLQGYEINVKHLPGRMNIVADALSRPG